MHKNVLKKGVSIRDLAQGLILSQFDELFAEMTQVMEKKKRISETKTKFEKFVSDEGWTSTKEFFSDLGYSESLTVKRSRVKLTSEQRTQIVECLKMGVKPTDEIATEFGISNDMVYSIKSKAGLTTPRAKKVPSPSETTIAVPTPLAAAA